MRSKCPLNVLSFARTLRACKRTFALTAAAAGLCLPTSIHAQAVLLDAGASDPWPVGDDIAQLLTSPEFPGTNPDGLNYFWNNTPCAGQTFTTGSNPQGYDLSSLALKTVVGDGGGWNLFNPFALHIYSVAGSAATLISTYAVPGFVLAAEGDWIQWKNLTNHLAPNTQYAFAFELTTGGSGWEPLGVSDNNLYAGGEIALIPAIGGTMAFGSSHAWDAAFVIGFAPAAVTGPGGTTIGIQFAGDGSRPVAARALGVEVADWFAQNDASGGPNSINASLWPSLTVQWTSPNIWQNGALSGDAGDNDVYYHYLDDGGDASGNHVAISGLNSVFPNGYIVQTAGSAGDGATRLGPVTVASGAYTLTYPSAQNLQGGGVGLSTPSPTLTLDAITVNGGPNQWHGGGAGVRCGLAGVILTDKPLIQAQPQKPASVVYTGQTFALDGMAAVGVAPLHYQWRKNGAAISGATGTNYTKSGASASDAGNYDVIVSNVHGSMTSSIVAIAINEQTKPYNLVIAPLAQTSYVGWNSTFTVTADGTTPLGFQWYKGGAPIDGANSASLTLSSVSISDTGNYSCVVTNVAGSVTSSVASLTVLALPFGEAGLVIGDQPLAYYRLNESAALVTPVAVNSGSLGADGNGAHFPGMVHQVSGAIVGDSDSAAGYTAIDSSSCDGAVATRIPYNPAFNPSGAFTVEFWAKPTLDGLGNAQCPMVSRFDDAGGNRSGWDFWQRASATGFNFRMFNGSGSGKVFSITGGTYTVGAWNHIVAVYDDTVPSATLYINGVQGAQSTSPDGGYNPNVTSDLFVGGFSTMENPFIGSLDEVAIYNKALTAEQVGMHYKNGTNAARSTPYTALVQADGAVEHLRLNEPAVNVAANSGSLGPVVNGVYSLTENGIAGPRPSDLMGFDSTNTATGFNGDNSYVELANPEGLNFSGQLTLEAWIQPDAVQNGEAYIIAHGGNDTWNAETMLRIENNNYQVGSINGKASFPVPSGDLGSGKWIHLVGTFNGAQWNLYRNGILVATWADTRGPSPIANANWAIGARGRWKNGAGFPNSGLERQFKGGIAGAAIYNRALSADRIQGHFLTGKYADGTAPTVITAPVSKTVYQGTPVMLSVVADGSWPFTYQWSKNNAPIDGATNSTFSVASAQTSDAGMYTVLISNAAGHIDSEAALVVIPGSVLADYGSVVLGDNPAAYYPLNEISGSTAYDRSSGANNGTYQGNVTLGIDGPTVFTGTGVNFDGSSAQVSLGDPNALKITGNITLEVWVKLAATDNDRDILGKGYTFNSPSGEMVLRVENGKYQAGVWDGSSTYNVSADIPAEDANTWVHLVGTYDGSNWNLYRNGSLLATASQPGHGAGSVGAGWAIGTGTDQGSGRFTKGGICQVAIYGHALSEAQIKAHHDAGIFSVRPINITASPATIIWSTGTLQQADSVTGPYSDVTGAVSPYIPTAGPIMKFYRVKF